MANPTTPNLELKLNEENEIGFKLNIEGTDPEIGTTKPIIRFTIMEGHTGRGWLFNTAKSSDSENICVTIPNMKGLVDESREYQGKLEVILGTRYFTPTEVDIRFVEPLKIEAAILTKTSVGEKPTTEEIQKDFSIHSEIDSVIVKPGNSVLKEFSPVAVKTKSPLTPKPLVTEDKKPPALSRHGISYSSLPEFAKTEINKIFLGECKKRGIGNPQKYMKEGTSYTKKRLRAMIAAATVEYLTKE